MLEMSVVERWVSNVPYLEGVGPSAVELQQLELEATTKRKAEMEVARARGKGTSAQEGGTLAHGARASRVEVRMTQTSV